MKKFNIDNYNEISKEDIIELAELAYSKMNELLKNGEKPKYTLLGNMTHKFEVGQIAVYSAEGSCYVNVDGLSIMGLAGELPNLSDAIATVEKEVSDIAETMYSIMYAKYSEIQFKLRRDKTLSGLNAIYDRLTEWKPKNRKQDQEPKFPDDRIG